MRVLQVMRATEALAVPKGPKALLLALARCEKDGIAIRSHDALARAVGASRRSVIRWQAHLEGLGLIVVKRRFAQGVQLRSSYRIERQLLAQLAAVGRDAISAVAAAVRIARNAARAKKIRCDSVAHSNGQDMLRRAWAVLADRSAPALDRERAVAALAGAGQGTATDIWAMVNGPG